MLNLYINDDDDSSAASVDPIAEVNDRRDREADFRNTCHAIMNEFDRIKRTFNQANCYLCSTLEVAIASMKRREAFVIFSIPKPIINNENLELSYAKLYIVGTQSRIFSVPQTLCTPFAMDEYIPNHRPTRLYLDIEIGKCERGYIDNCNIGRILRAHFQQTNFQSDPAFEERIVQQYKEASCENWSETSCRAGVSMILDHVTSTIKDLVENVQISDADYAIATGCRDTKFSIHIVLTNLFCDSNVLTTPLVVFEIARRWFDKQLRWFRENDRANLNSPASKFRLRSLMIERMVINPQEITSGSTIKFKGYNDSPIDEEIYRKNSFLRSAGCTKANKRVPAMIPVDLSEPGLLINGNNKAFRDIFKLDQTGFDEWKRYLVCDPTMSNVNEVQILAGWKPTPAFPHSQRWYGYHTEFYNGNTELETMSFRVLQTYNQTRLFVESRQTTSPRRSLTPTEIAIATMVEEYRFDESWYTVDANFVFKSTDGTRKKLKYFVAGDVFHHVCDDGVEDAEANAKVFEKCRFRCFKCNKTFCVPRSPTAEDPYPFEPHEIDKTTDENSYIPKSNDASETNLRGIDWKKLDEKKWTIVSAPMGSGKTEQISILLNEVVRSNESSYAYTENPMPTLPGNKTVCVISFRRYLAI